MILTPYDATFQRYDNRAPGHTGYAIQGDKKSRRVPAGTVANIVEKDGSFITLEIGDGWQCIFHKSDVKERTAK